LFPQTNVIIAKNVNYRKIEIADLAELTVDRHKSILSDCQTERVEGFPASVRFWWVNAGALDTSSFAAFVQTLGLQNNLPDLLGATPDTQAWLVVDGLDGAYAPGVFRNLSQLLLLSRNAGMSF
jgi:hypothetical protein